MTQDQVMALARQLLPILGTLMTVLGFKSATAQATVDLILQIIGPIFVLGSVIWSFIANTRASIMASAAKPVAVGAPAPEIILPRQERDLAASLPANVTSK
jgi:hypothetical protein